MLERYRHKEVELTKVVKKLAKFCNIICNKELQSRNEHFGNFRHLAEMWLSNGALDEVREFESGINFSTAGSTKSGENV